MNNRHDMHSQRQINTGMAIAIWAVMIPTLAIIGGVLGFLAGALL